MREGDADYETVLAVGRSPAGLYGCRTSSENSHKLTISTRVGSVILRWTIWLTPLPLAFESAVTAEFGKYAWYKIL